MLINKTLEFKCENSGILHPVNIKVTKRKKTISIRIDKNKILVNTPNFIKEDYILSLLERKKEWIRQTILKNNEQYKNNFINREAFYLGKKYKINTKKGLSNEVIFKNDNLKILYKRKNINVKDTLERWYRLRCHLLLEERLNYFSKRTNLKYNSFSIRSFKRRLGSCDSKKNLSFNWKIILMPIQIIDYIVIHELCHIIHFNHSKLFWREVYKFCPEYKSHKSWLKDNLSILNY
jgi:predicted metal-dependent hydrolase